MKHGFWQERWDAKQIGFHNQTVHPLLEKYINVLSLPTGARIFIPLCGKTLDIHWLLSKGYNVSGSELVESAVQELFQELGITPTVTPFGKLKHYKADGIDIFAGDIFKLDAAALGTVDVIYDRAALVALPPKMRAGYTAHLAEITKAAPQLLISFEYNQDHMDGPPFSVPEPEISRHYQSRYTPILLGRHDVAGGLKGKCPATEDVWQLSPITQPIAS